jgi:ribonuclease P/MRP protein subunit RPP40
VELESHIRKAGDDKLITGLVFVDFSKAFDSINHQILIHQLKLLGVSGNTLSWFISYFNDRSISVQNGKHSFTPRTINRGTPQGSSLSGLLFAIYINCLPKIFKNCKAILCADDLVLWVSLKTLSDIPVALQLDLHSLELWCVNNNMEINGSKTKSMIITPKMNVLEKIDLTISGESIDEVQTFRYLGLTIDKNLTWNTQYQEVSERMSQRIYLINRQKKCVSQKWLQIFCTSLVISVPDYCLIAWGNLSHSKYKRIDLLLFKAAKIVLPKQKFNKNNRNELFERMNWLTSAERYELYSLVYVHKNVSNKTSLTASLLQFFVKIPETKNYTDV